MIYFNHVLQARVHRLLYESLVLLGYLGLGSRETVATTPHENSYDVVDEREKLYRKAR
jgi:chemotaxis protein methyltransferase CheR